MIHWRSGEVERVRTRWSGAVEYDVRLTAEPGREVVAGVAAGTDVAGGPARSVRALAYPDLVGTPAVGDLSLIHI